MRITRQFNQNETNETESKHIFVQANGSREIADSVNVLPQKSHCYTPLAVTNDIIRSSVTHTERYIYKGKLKTAGRENDICECADTAIYSVLFSKSERQTKRERKRVSGALSVL